MIGFLKGKLGLVSTAIVSGLLLMNAACQPNTASSSQAPVAPTYGNYATTPQPCNYMSQPGQQPAYGQPGYNQPGYNQPYNGYPNGLPPPGYNNGYNGNNGYNSCSNYNVNYPYANNQQWNTPNWNYGAWMWPQQWAPQTGACGCPSGYRPVMSQYYGFSCAPDAYFNNYSVTWYNWGYFAGQYQNMQWVNNPQVNFSNNSCNQIAQGCDVRLNNCSAGQFCQPVGGGSTIGLCTR